MFRRPGEVMSSVELGIRIAGGLTADAARFTQSGSHDPQRFIPSPHAQFRCKTPVAQSEMCHECTSSLGIKLPDLVLVRAYDSATAHLGTLDVLMTPS